MKGLCKLGKSEFDGLKCKNFLPFNYDNRDRTEGEYLCERCCFQVFEGDEMLDNGMDVEEEAQEEYDTATDLWNKR